MGDGRQPPDAAAFEKGIRLIWKNGKASGLTFVEIESGDLHRRLGGYPGPGHRMPDCCQVMRRLMTGRDSVLKEPPSGKGATLLIRYALPR